jgi:hypothetical protein
MAGILSFSQYLGGPDNVQVEQIFPSNQKTLVYTFKDAAGAPIDLTGWTFTADYQTIVVDTVAFNRNTGQPNFSNSSVIGSFAKVDISGVSLVQPKALSKLTFLQTCIPALLFLTQDPMFL